jgi:hypothetical protein
MRPHWIQRFIKGRPFAFIIIVIIISVVISATVFIYLRSESDRIKHYNFLEYYVLVKVEGGNAPYTLHLPVTTYEETTSNLSNNTTDKTGHCIPTCTRVEELGINPDIPISFSFEDLKYGRGLSVSSNASVFLFSHLRVSSLDERPTIDYSMTTDLSSWIYLERTDNATKVSVSMISLGEMTYILSRHLDIVAIVDGPLLTDIDCYNAQCYIEELFKVNDAIELQDGWHEYPISFGELSVPIS